MPCNCDIRLSVLVISSQNLNLVTLPFVPNRIDAFALFV
jgi:hypothetical protein